MGMGLHGEPGLWRRDLTTARDLAAEMVQRLLDDPVPDRGEEVALLLNNLGATPLEELLILLREVRARLDSAGVAMPRVLLEPMVTSLDMPGVSLSLMWLDRDLAAALDSPAQPVFGGGFS